MFFTVYVLGTCSLRLCKHKTEVPAICLFCACVFLFKKNTLDSQGPKKTNLQTRPPNVHLKQ